MFSWPAGLGVAAGFILGLYAHDFAHHGLAVRLGDKTPKLMGRFPPKPGTAADPLGTYVMPGIFTVTAAFGHILVPFGWTRPHSFGLRGMRGGKRDVVLISLAGPAATALLAAAAGLIWRLSLTPADRGGVHLLSHPESLFVGLQAFALVTSALTIFEILPIPGRDGARILGQFVSPRAAMKIEELADYHVLFLLVLLLFLREVATSMMFVTCGVLANDLC